MKGIKFWKIARLVIRAVRAAIDELEKSKDPKSDGGTKVTPEEALEISASVLASLVEPLGNLLSDG